MKLKPKTITGFVLMLGFGALLFLNFGQQVGGYMDFVEAEETGVEAHVVGTWVEAERYAYDRDRNVFSFHMQDEEGQVRLVEYPNPKPANFEDAERLVVQGATEGEIFVARHILVKCPSKYNDGAEFQAAS